mmetsp:Transcript_2464/g.5012  ORF Transcript_2464/g.5012 Transcript_2464/m.5012 type:complete len:403 (-) Transcript_2464:146-1354(-)
MDDDGDDDDEDNNDVVATDGFEEKIGDSDSDSSLRSWSLADDDATGEDEPQPPGTVGKSPQSCTSAESAAAAGPLSAKQASRASSRNGDSSNSASAELSWGSVPDGSESGVGDFMGILGSPRDDDDDDADDVDDDGGPLEPTSMTTSSSSGSGSMSLSGSGSGTSVPRVLTRALVASPAGWSRRGGRSEEGGQDHIVSEDHGGNGWLRSRNGGGGNGGVGVGVYELADSAHHDQGSALVLRDNDGDDGADAESARSRRVLQLVHSARLAVEAACVERDGVLVSAHAHEGQLVLYEARVGVLVRERDDAVGRLKSLRKELDSFFLLVAAGSVALFAVALAVRFRHPLGLGAPQRLLRAFARAAVFVLRVLLRHVWLVAKWAGLLLAPSSPLAEMAEGIADVLG